MITRWPYRVRDRHAGKITIYGWSTSALLDESEVIINNSWSAE
jgi:hypothetical protein